MNLSYLQIEENLSLASVNADDIFVIWSRSLGSLAGIKASDFQIGTSSNFEWVFDRDYDFDEVVTFNGLWWQSLIAGIGTNTGNVPAEGLNWTQINKISGIIIPFWTPGLVTDHLTLFREGNLIYGLKDTVTLPFDSQTTPSADPTNWEPIVSKFQDIYEVSDSIQILTNATKGAFTIRRASALDTDNIYEGQNGAGTITFSVNGNGDIEASRYHSTSDGILSNTSFGWSSDTSIGLIRNGAGDFSIINNAIETMNFDPSNNVTIPNGDLIMNGNKIFLDDGTNDLFDFTGFNLAFVLGGTSRMSIGFSAIVFGGGSKTPFVSIVVPALANVQYSFIGDSNTGLFSDTDDEVSLVSGAVIGLTVDASQNVTVPNGKFNITDRIALGLTVGDVATPLEGEFWYNFTLKKYRGNENGTVVSFIGGASAGANNEIQASDGAGGFVASKLFFDEATGDMSLGDSGLGGSGRDITAVGSATDIGITLRPKGANFVVVDGTLRTTGQLLTLGNFNLSGSGGIDFTIDVTDGSYSHVFETANTSTIGDYNIVVIRSTGTVAAGFGGQRAISMQLAGGGTQGSLFREEFSWETVDTNGLWDLQIFGRSAFAMAGDSSAPRVGFLETTPIVKQTTTSQTPATFVANSSGISDDTATWNGYTMGDLIAIMQAYGLLT